MKDAAPEHAAIAASKIATYSGATAAVTSGLTLSEWGVIIGICVGVLGLLFGQYWAWRKESRERARDAAVTAAYLQRMAAGSSKGTAPMPLDMCANDAEERRA